MVGTALPNSASSRGCPPPRTSGLEPEVLQSLHAVIPTGDDAPFKTLEVVGAIAVERVLN